MLSQINSGISVDINFKHKDFYVWNWLIKHNYFEAVYIKNGWAEHIIGDQRIRVTAGDFFIIDYDTFHMFKVEKGETLDIVNIIFKGEMVDLSLKGCHSFFQLCKNYFIRYK